ncbi:MAG: hypothetical protein QOG54_1209 [Actinomycetota bacterium]|jgi:hypothetical protein|nr:hypothetical protein [Actinomycetota bacterium]
MVKRMIIKGVIVAPFLVAALWIWNGSEYALSGAVGLALTMANLWIAGKLIGTIAERNPKLLLAAAMLAFMLGLGVLSIAALALKATDVVYFPVTGVTLVVSHLVLVGWEAALTYKIDPKKSQLHAQKT